MVKLHLGCGGRHLDGYVNIDFPPVKHTLLHKNYADVYADITAINFPLNSIHEIRIHHAFEHFQRPIACALIVSWYSWLDEGGLLRIEVPDFQKMASIMVSLFSTRKQKLLAERHIFGSQEADWGIHYEGYTPALMKNFIESFGFKTIKIIKNNWLGTYNFELYAKKKGLSVNQEEFEQRAIQYLEYFLVENAGTETELLKIWVAKYQEQIHKTWGRKRDI